MRPKAWREIGRELVPILPPQTLLNVARIPGALKLNLVALAAVLIVGYGLYRLTGDAPQWTAYGLGVYAIFALAFFFTPGSP